jgi:hypothetical protein
MSSDFPVQDASSVVRNDEEAVQHTEGQLGHSKEIHRGNGFPMIA